MLGVCTTACVPHVVVVGCGFLSAWVGRLLIIPLGTSPEGGWGKAHDLCLTLFCGDTLHASLLVTSASLVQWE